MYQHVNNHEVEHIGQERRRRAELRQLAAPARAARRADRTWSFAGRARFRRRAGRIRAAPSPQPPVDPAARPG